MLSFVTTWSRIVKLIVDPQRIALISFLGQFASYIERENIFRQEALIDLEPPCVETQFFEQCGRVKSKVEGTFSREEIHYICIDIMNSVERSTDCFTRLLDVLTSAEKTPTNIEISNGSETSAYD